MKTFVKIVRRSTADKTPTWRTYLTLGNFDTYYNDAFQWHPPSHESIVTRWKKTPQEFSKCEE